MAETAFRGAGMALTTFNGNGGKDEEIKAIRDHLNISWIHCAEGPYQEDRAQTTGHLDASGAEPPKRYTEGHDMSTTAV
ncbi:hypothetical protein BGZ58_006973 [Dissophora ornata]|nr:hypothetical protein BGZ58_006973 [Dissophora ornata]